MRPFSIILLLLVALGACRANTKDDPGVDPYAKDISEMVFGLGGVVAVCVGIFQFRRDSLRNREQRQKELQEARHAREQREEELRWRKAGLAREALNELWGSPQAMDAMRMLDWDLRPYQVGGKNVDIGRADVLNALRTTNLDFEDHELFIRDCFDEFFGSMQLIEHYIRTGLIVPEDVQFPFSYYAGKMAPEHDVYKNFLREYEYDLAESLLNRLATWPSASPPA